MVANRITSAASDSVAQLSDKSRAMVLEGERQRSGTRKRALVPMAAGAAAVTVLFQMVAAQLLAVNFTTSNSEFKLYSNYLDARQAASFLAPTTKQNGSQQGVAELGIATAKLAGLCGITTETLLGTSWSLLLTAGDPVPDSFDGTSIPSGVTVDSAGQLSGASATNAVTADKLYINSDTITGYGNKISGLNLGQSANTVGTQAGITWPSGQSAPTAGSFGLYANQLNVAGLGGESFGLNLEGAITLPKLSIKIMPGALNQTHCS